MRSFLVLLVSLAPFAVAAGCSSDGSSPTKKTGDATLEDAGITPGVVPACGDTDHAPTCPKPAPSYAKDVTPILDEKCGGCHTGPPAPWQLAPYEDLMHWRSQVQETLVGCTMPPLDAGLALSDTERATLIGWVACGAPNN